MISKGSNNVFILESIKQNPFLKKDPSINYQQYDKTTKKFKEIIAEKDSRQNNVNKELQSSSKISNNKTDKFNNEDNISNEKIPKSELDDSLEDSSTKEVTDIETLAISPIEDTTNTENITPTFNESEEIDPEALTASLGEIINVLQSNMDGISKEELGKLLETIENLNSIIENLDLSNLNSSEQLKLNNLLTELQLSYDKLQNTDFYINSDWEALNQKVDNLINNLNDTLNNNVSVSNNLENATSTLNGLSTSDNSNQSNDNSNTSNNNQTTNGGLSNSELDKSDDSTNLEKGIFAKDFSITDKRNIENQINDTQSIDATVVTNETKNINNLQFESITKTLTQNNQTSFSNIMNQVIESAQVSLDENMSEMLIKLKPESLGDLSMKIVIEKGMIIAKFDVESQIVKQALESNLQDLRSALDDKGIQVQEFSVSVNQNSKQHKNPQFSNKKNKRYTTPFVEEGITNNIYHSNSSKYIGMNSTVNFLA